MENSNVVAAEQVKVLLGRSPPEEVTAAVPLFVFDAGYDPVRLQQGLEDRRCQRFSSVCERVAASKYPLVSSCATGYATPPRQAEVNVNAGNRGTAPPADPGRARRTKGYVASGGSCSSGTRASGDGQGRRLGPRPRADNGLERAHAAHGAPLVGRVRQRRDRGARRRPTLGASRRGRRRLP